MLLKKHFFAAQFHILCGSILHLSRCENLGLKIHISFTLFSDQIYACDAEMSATKHDQCTTIRCIFIFMPSSHQPNNPFGKALSFVCAPAEDGFSCWGRWSLTCNICTNWFISNHLIRWIIFLDFSIIFNLKVSNILMKGFLEIWLSFFFFNDGVGISEVFDLIKLIPRLAFTKLTQTHTTMN